MTLIAAARAAAQCLQAVPNAQAVQIVAHGDADGVASASVAVRALARLGRPFHVRFTFEHDPDSYAKAPSAPGEVHLFLDIGASLLPVLSQWKGTVIVLDHHRPAAAATSDRLASLNPHDEGLDGMRDACGSTTTLAWAVALDERNWDLAPHALAGAYADRQERGGLRAWNATVLEEGARRGHITLQPRLQFDDAPLLDLLAHPPPPLRDALPSGYEAAQAFLKAYGLPGEATVHELGEKDQERLASALALALLRRGAPPEAVSGLVAPHPISVPHAGLPLIRIRSLLEAATREGEPGLALSLLLGDEAARGPIEDLEVRYHEKIRTHLRRLTDQPPRELRALRAFPVDEPAYLGTLSGLAMDAVLTPDKATLAYATSGDRAQVSARATPGLVERGVDLGTALRDAAEAVRGVGGGHRIASGASVPAASLETFLERVDRTLLDQLNGGPAP